MIDLVAQTFDLDLKKRGTKYYALCPFHEEEVPSFVIYEETSSYYCFGCHVSGSLRDLLLQSGVDSNLLNSISSLEPRRVSFSEEILEEVKEPPGDKILSDNFLLRRFGIKYIQTGVFAGRHLVPYFRNGVIFCYEARDFSSRLYPKVIALSGSKIRDTLWNLDNITRQEPLLLVEGVKDALFMISYGYSNVVSSSGAGLSEKQSRLLDQPGENLIIMYDGDPAGWLGTIEVILKFRNITPLVAGLPPQTDPASAGEVIVHDSINNAVIVDSNKAVIAMTRYKLFRRSIIFEELQPS